ncbi:beta-lactamase-like protein [Boletus coccyginus]|nr:beta-lactamase-like protein [Boletus coccyginus]
MSDASSDSRAGLVVVDKFTVTFLVDNCIEWMTKLPPGFTHELRQHLFDQYAAKDVRTGVPILDFENFCCGAHGFSALIETQVDGQNKHLVLFDTGPDSKSIVRNVLAMQAPVDDVETVILSHWHSDHSGGMLSFLGMRSASARACIVDLHPDRPEARGIAVPPTFETVICRLPDDPTFEQIENAGGTVRTSRDAHTVAEGTIYVSGEIPRVTPYEGGLLGGVRFRKEGGWVSEPHLMDERYAAIDVAGKGLVIFSACSHAGIVNVVKDAVRKLVRPVYMVVGGLHLAGPELVPRIPHTVNFLANELRPAPTYVLPMHCSGFQSKIALERAFGDGCVPGGVGMKVEIRGDREGDTRLLPAVFA